MMLVGSGVIHIATPSHNGTCISTKTMYLVCEDNYYSSDPMLAHKVYEVAAKSACSSYRDEAAVNPIIQCQNLCNLSS